MYVHARRGLTIAGECVLRETESGAKAVQADAIKTNAIGVPEMLIDLPKILLVSVNKYNARSFPSDFFIDMSRSSRTYFGVRLKCQKFKN